MEPLVVASGNPHKVEEMRAVLVAAGVPVAGLRDLPGHEGFTEPAEHGGTFEENAAIKARSYAAQTGRVCLADDSGLEVDALGGRPGVISSHYCTDGRDEGMSREERDRLNNQRVLRELEGVAPEKRGARFVCVMCVARPAAVEGPIGEPDPQGGAGFQPARGALPVPVSKRAVNTQPPGTLEITRRNLPHWRRGGSTYFVTFRLMSGELSETERQVVLDACLYWHGRRALVDLVCVMPDHAHLLITPLPDGRGGWHSLSKIMQSVKGFSARQINLARGREGTLWQDESYDRIIRGVGDFEEKWNYIYTNPWRAGLVGDPREYPFIAGGSQRDGGRLKACPTQYMAYGTFEGRIGLPGEVPRGGNGFGYDPIFLVAPGFARTSAELPPEEKNRLSHRARAAERMAAWLRENGAALGLSV